MLSSFKTTSPHTKIMFSIAENMLSYAENMVSSSETCYLVRKRVFSSKTWHPEQKTCYSMLKHVIQFGKMSSSARNMLFSLSSSENVLSGAEKCNPLIQCRTCYPVPTMFDVKFQLVVWILHKAFFECESSRVERHCNASSQ